MTVRTPSRLHFGIIDLSSNLGRKYGGIGVALERPNVILEASPAEGLSVSGEKASLTEFFARRFLSNYRIEKGASIQVREVIPEHVGLGSVTQLSLATASALAKIFGLDVPVRELAAVLKRGEFSGVGTAVFGRGGFVVEGGHKLLEGKIAGSIVPPLIVRLPFPEKWIFVVAIPDTKRGLDEAQERLAFERLRTPPRLADKISRLVLMKMLPSLVESDLSGFGSALTEVQRLVGSCFRGIQGGIFSSPVVEECVNFMRDNGASGVGQSSWGPAVYGLVEGKKEAKLLREKIEDFLGGGNVFCARADNEGARIGIVK